MSIKLFRYFQILVILNISQVALSQVQKTTLFHGKVVRDTTYAVGYHKYLINFRKMTLLQKVKEGDELPMTKGYGIDSVQFMDQGSMKLFCTGDGINQVFFISNSEQMVSYNPLGDMCYTYRGLGISVKVKGKAPTS
jgi:hypothetical protein